MATPSKDVNPSRINNALTPNATQRPNVNYEQLGQVTRFSVTSCQVYTVQF